MRIQIKKFGKLLNSRPAGKEAALRMIQIINGSIEDNEIILDFAGVEIITPSFADEFIEMLRQRYKEKLIRIENIETSIVNDTLEAVGFRANRTIRFKP